MLKTVAYCNRMEARSGLRVVGSNEGLGWRVGVVCGLSRDVRVRAWIEATELVKRNLQNCEKEPKCGC